MSSKRTRRIQTVISPEHHDLLLELTRTHGKMNHIIEQGIEQVYQNKTGIHTCEASKTLNIQEKMIEGGYIFFDRKFIEDFFNGILNGNLIEWVEEFQKTNVEAANPLLTIIDVENTYQGLLEYLQLESDYFKLYNVKFFNENEKSITLQPLLFPQYPELTTTVLCRTLDFLNFSYVVELQNNQILLKFTKEKTNASILARNEVLKERFEILWSQLNPIGYYRYKLTKEKEQTVKVKSQQNFTNNVVNALETYTIYNWESGALVTKDSRSILLPQSLLTKLLSVSSIKDQLLNEISDLILSSYQGVEFKDEIVSDLLKSLNIYWSNVGLGAIQTEIEQKGDDQFIIFSNSLLSPKDISTILNPILGLIHQSLTSDDDEIKNKVAIKLISKSKSILLVDDEQDVIDALKREIKKVLPQQTNIKTTTSPTSVQKMLEKEQFDIILIDYKMKEMTGVDVLEGVKGKYPHMKRVLITGFGDTDIMKEAINRAGIDYFINKPWNKNDLLKAFEN